MPKHISKEEKDEIVEFYKSKPMDYTVVCEHFGRSQPTIGKILKEYRIKPYSKAKLFSPDLNENYFSDIDTEYKAYFLGLIITDGCVYSKNNKQSFVSITLQEKDSYILEEFKSDIKSNKKIVSDNRGTYSISIISNSIVNDLNKYGVIDNKSLKTIFPDNINPLFYRHLIRGLFDGDGSISFYARPNKKSHVKAIRLCQGNEKFLLDVMDYLDQNVGIKPVHTYQEKESLWSIAYRNNESMMKLYHYLYDDATIYLKRKKDLCDKIVNEIIYYHGNTEITN
jgi:hypothetical protein